MEQELPDRRRVVVDGSNIATEGRTLPSLAQLDEAIRAFLEEYRGFTSSDVTVVVDASFGHRIDPSEVADFEQAVEHGEMVAPPAGAVGRGDGFILRIAEKSGALVLSNDSFQEFHAERPWLFEPGRLIGGKPVPGVGWIFTPRTPVRGAKSRSVTSKSKRDAKAAGVEQSGSGNEQKRPDSGPRAQSGRGDRPAKAAATRATGTKATAGKAEPAVKAEPATKAAKSAKVSKATKAAKSAKSAKSTKSTKAATGTKAEPTVKATKATKATKTAKSRTATGTATAVKAGKPAKLASPAESAATAPSSRSEALNEPMTFLTFVADHPIGSTFEGTVVSFTSHGAHIDVGGMLCHVPLRLLADPPPNKARQVLTKGEIRPFTLVSLDAARRRAELALPEMAG
jgi:Zc3h12a-like Ribonuclease NYN domain/S1 RNA binding domain